MLIDGRARNQARAARASVQSIYILLLVALGELLNRYASHESPMKFNVANAPPVL
jgi:hypothetical protein